MKKRVFSFVIILVTLFAVIAFGAPSIKNNSKTGMEFNGGFDILYEITTEDEDMSNKNLAKTAAEGIEKRLDIANTIDPIVSVEGDKYVRVTVSASNQIIADDIRSIIENNAEISFRDFENNLLATGEEILKDVGATLSSELSADGYPIILLNIKDTELLSEITESVSSMSDTHLVVWLGYEEGDDYANLETDASVAKKIIYNATVSEKLDTDTITVTGQFSKSVAQSTVDLINSGTLDYELKIVQISSLEVNEAQSAYTKVLIASLVALVLVVVFLSVNYKLGGLVASAILLFDVFLTVTLFVAFKGIVNQQAIAALIVALGLAIDAIIVLFERTNIEIYNGKNVVRAFKEGCKKSVHSIVDSNVVIMIMAIVMFFFGSSVGSFSTMLALSSVSTLVVMPILTRLILSYYAKLSNKPTAFGAKKAYIENKEAYTTSKNANADLLKNTKKYFIGSGAFVALSLIVMLVFQLATGSLFNYNKTIKENSSITIVSTQEYFTDNEHIMRFFDEGELNIELTGIETSTFEDSGIKKYKVTVTTDASVAEQETELTNKVIETFGENKEYDERYELYINDINPKSAFVSTTAALNTISLALVLVAIYLAVKYRYTYAVAAVASTAATILLTALFFGLTRIKIGSDVVIAIFAISVFGLNTLVVVFNKLKELLSGTTKKYLSNEERYEAIRKAINSTLPRMIISSAVVVGISIVLLAFSTAANYSFYLALIVGTIFGFVNSTILASRTWLAIEKLSDRKKREFKSKKNRRFFKDTEEQTFVGIND